jgi:tetratricopeptide (TPR) repeat protein
LIQRKAQRALSADCVTITARIASGRPSPRSTLGYLVKGHVLRIQNRWEEAVPEYEAALALDHNFVPALNNLGWCKLYAGSIEVTPLAEQAIRLSPRDPSIGFRYYLIGTVHLLQSHLDEAIVWFEKARSALPNASFEHSRLAAAYALKGDTERAAVELAEARRLDGGDLFSSIAHLKAFPGAWQGCRRSAPCTNPLISPGCAKPACPLAAFDRSVALARTNWRH